MEKRVDRALKFLADKTPGKLLIMRNDLGVPCFETHWIERLTQEPVEYFLDPARVSDVNDEFLRETRGLSNRTMAVDDDAVHTVEVYFSIGSVTSMMCGVRATFGSGTGWCEPNMSVSQAMEAIQFNAENPWVRFHDLVIADMIRKWDGDYTLSPCFHRSPLDAANGLCGNELFVDMYDRAEEVLTLIRACAQWSIALEDHWAQAHKWPTDLKRGVWGLTLPEGAVFVNGDPVDLISAEHQQFFDEPSCSLLFTQTGGGFFHHHALGIRQVGNVAKTQGILAQNIYTDPKIETPANQLFRDEALCEQIVNASLVAPIHIGDDFLPIIDRLLPILRRGRFILRQENTETMEGLLKKLDGLRS